MKKHLFLVLIVFCWSTPVIFAREWGEKYSDELYVYDLIEEVIEMNEDYTYTQTLHDIICVQKEGAKDEDIGEIKVYYEKDFEKVTSTKGNITLPGGKKLKYNKKQDLSLYYDEPLYSDSRVIIMSMPNVMPDSIIEWTASINCFVPNIKNNAFFSFDFNFYVPVKLIQGRGNNKT